MPTVKTTVQTYPAGTRWTITSRYGHVQTEELALYPEVNGSTITDDYTTDEISASDLWRKWIDRYATDAYEQDPARYRLGEVTIYWTVTLPSLRGIFEAAPYVPIDPAPHAPDGLFPDFLTYYETPVNADTGEPLNWLRLPVLDRGWNETTGDKGGFIQELTGWKPSPLQSTMDAIQIGRAAGLYVPTLP